MRESAVLSYMLSLILSDDGEDSEEETISAMYVFNTATAVAMAMVAVREKRANAAALKLLETVSYLDSLVDELINIRLLAPLNAEGLPEYTEAQMARMVEITRVIETTYNTEVLALTNEVGNALQDHRLWNPYLQLTMVADGEDESEDENPSEGHLTYSLYVEHMN